MLSGRRDGHKGRQVAVVIQESVELETCPGATEGGPGKEREAQAHHRGVQAAELVFEPEAVPGDSGQTALIHEGKPGLEKAGRPLLIGVGAGGAGWAAGAVLCFQFGQMMSRNQFEHLMKDCVTMGHSPKSPFCLIGYG